jgi:hypothetical protein
VFSWQAHPARERVGQALAVVFLISALGFLSALLMGSPWWGILAAGLMVLGLNRFFFPSRFRIDEEGITAEFPMRSRRFAWVELQRFAHGPRGGYLSSRSRPSRLEGRRGLHILFGEARESVVPRIEARLPEGAGE